MGHTLTTTDMYIRSITAELRTQTKFNADHSRRMDEVAAFVGRQEVVNGRQEAFNERQEAFNAGIESKVATVMTKLDVILSRLPES